ncbi:MAG: hypothetical protein ACP5GN_07795 [Fervidicoccaceae archaeon]
MDKQIGSLSEDFRESYCTKEFMIAHAIVDSYKLKAVEKAKLFENALVFLHSSSRPIIIPAMQSEKAVWRFLFINGLEKNVSVVLGRPKFGSKNNELKWVKERYAFTKKVLLWMTLYRTQRIT